MDIIKAIENIDPKYRLNASLVLLDRILPLWDSYFKPSKDSINFYNTSLSLDLVSDTIILGKHRLTMDTMFQKVLFISRWKYLKDKILPIITSIQNEELSLPYTVEQIILIIYAIVEGMDIKHKQEVSALYLLESIQISIWLLKENGLETNDSILHILKSHKLVRL